MSEEIQKTESVGGALAAYAPKSEAAQTWELLQRKARAFAESDLVPKEYKGRQANCVVALEMANRLGVAEMAVMQNLHIIHGRPAWSSQFVIAALNSCGKFSPLRFEIKDLGKKTVEYEYTVYNGNDKTKKAGKVDIHDFECIAVATDKETGEVLKGPEVTIELAVKEGWYTKDGSKWKTMPKVMLRYRAAKFFGSFNAPNILMGMGSTDEAEDIHGLTPRDVTPGETVIGEPTPPPVAVPAPAAGSSIKSKLAAKKAEAAKKAVVETTAAPAPAEAPAPDGDFLPENEEV